MKSRKQRPVNGPGANGLRGGTNLYSTKTTIARWLDDVGGPSAFKRGFNTPEFETEAQHQQCGATLKAPSYYGSELAKVDNTNKPVATVWETTARNMNTGVNKNANSHMPESNVNGEELDEYRRTWTSDVPASRDMRYQTESRRAASNMPIKYQTASVRMLPGTPRSLEMFREKLVERHGILAISAMRHYVGRGQISCDELLKMIVQMEVNLNRAELNQILAYFTASTMLSADQFIRTVLAKSDGFGSAFPSPIQIFELLFGEGLGEISFDTLLDSFNTEKYYEVVEGLSLYIFAYSVESPNSITRNEFALILSDFHASTQYNYQTILTNLFK